MSKVQVFPLHGISIWISKIYLMGQVVVNNVFKKVSEGLGVRCQDKF